MLRDLCKGICCSYDDLPTSMAQKEGLDGLDVLHVSFFNVFLIIQSDMAETKRFFEVVAFHKPCL